jgi:phage-related protein
MKGICFMGKSLDAIRAFPEDARQQAGYQLDRVQRGLEPADWKPMKSDWVSRKSVSAKRAGPSG